MCRWPLVPSSRKVRPQELEFILVHEESRKVLMIAGITCYGQHYRGPDE